jgi:hypothetical protein|tara:strand:- start:764 stop:1129 length:366 start_codon:yes stop_codon:yes gene_type:complete
MIKICRRHEPTKRSILLTNFIKMLILFTGVCIFTSACVTLGKDYPVSRVVEIKIGKTSKNEIRKMFGPPWLSGFKDGELTWTYSKYDYSLFGERKAKVLVVQFGKNRLVTTFTFNTTEHNE